MSAKSEMYRCYQAISLLADFLGILFRLSIKILISLIRLKTIYGGGCDSIEVGRQCCAAGENHSDMCALIQQLLCNSQKYYLGYGDRITVTKKCQE